MRERLAKAYAVGLVVLMTGLAAVFAERQNATGAAPSAARTSPPTVPPPAAPPDPAVVALGRAVLEAEGCLRCHRVAGEGSPRSVLDGVGSRLPPEELRAWIVGDEFVRAALPASVARAKAPYAELPPDRMDALVAYLTTLRDGG